ncbi:MAG: hypothetical protein A2X49_02630 [Lentisphaerae bacterium GWF2_52_8]|nr:MAG: hypothetical protein A2X49_02630 [Lentisphaerae bacterium GWF2_52_8]
MLEGLQENIKKLPDGASLTELKKEIGKMKKLEEDMKNLPVQSAWRNAEILCYNVPPLSGVKRVPDVLPEDGKICDTVSIIAAQGEYEPASFVIFPFCDIAKLDVEIADLKNRDQVLPASQIDRKVVKCWFQSGTGWNSNYQCLSRRILLPELLLNDETLVKLDMETQDNYVRLEFPDKTEYICVSNPEDKLTGDPWKHSFPSKKYPIKDSSSLKPIELKQGEAKQLWLTAHIPEKQMPGIYRGQIVLKGDGRIIGRLELSVRVLPFSLPASRAYYDLSKPYYSAFMTRSRLSGAEEGDLYPTKRSDSQIRAELINLRCHNVDYLFSYNVASPSKPEMYIKLYGMMKEAGMPTRPLFGNVPSAGVERLKTEEQKAKYAQTIKESLDFVEKQLGHRDAYFVGWDESGPAGIQAQRPAWEIIRREGGKIMATVPGAYPEANFNISGDIQDMVIYNGLPTRTVSGKWHALGKLAGFCVNPYTGVENPELNRRNFGIVPYKANFDYCSPYNYYEFGSYLSWNDWGDGFRCFNVVYPSSDGVIDTVHWEAYREAVDDIRYATKLKMLAVKAQQSHDYERKRLADQALWWLEKLDEGKEDLDAVRLEMINYILQLLPEEETIQ